jgi:myo-inositol catabolism protein IolC
LRAGKVTRAEAVAEIARHYREFVDIFEKTRASTAAPVSD